MNRAAILRLAHAFVAGLVALASYGIVIYVSADQADTWNVFGAEGCRAAVDAIFCVLAGAISIIFNLVIFGIPLAIAASSIYLKLVHTSLARSMLVAIAANVIWALSIMAIVQYVGLYSIPLYALLVPLTYIVVSLPLVMRHKTVAK